MVEDSGHAHEHELVEIVDSEFVSAFEERPHNVFTLQFHSRGLALQLDRDEALALAQVMADVQEYLQKSRT